MPIRLLPLILVLAWLHPAFAADETVLLLHGQAGPSAWTDELAAGVAGEAGSTANVQREYLGGGHLDADTVDRFAVELEGRLTRPIHMVIATDAEAGAFTAKYREDLFPEAAVVLTGPDRIDPGRLAMCGDCAGLGPETDLAGTLDLIFALRPETGLVVGVADDTPSGRVLRDRLEKTMQRHGNGAELVFPGHEPGNDDGLDLDGLGEVLSNMPSHSVAVLLHFSEDNQGTPVEAGQLNSTLARAASPVFVLTDATLGSGVVGGLLVTGRETGRQAVRLARRILAGEPAREMLPEPVAAEVVLDGTVLTRFGIRAPDGASVVNRPAAPETSDGVTSGVAPLAAAAVVVFLAALLVLRRYRQKM